ncbi:hypothetical protein PINS_up017866 [Pythium insidiosum]|nr:hypothetical protein PINS_up017866 [Pythium insidiosum]
MTPLPLLQLLLLLSLFTSNASASLRSIPVPSVDFSALNDLARQPREELRRHLGDSGLVAIRGLPQYASLRSQLLHAATDCVLRVGSSAEALTHGVLHRTLRDGTTRATISTRSVLHEPDAATSAIEAACPRYMLQLRALSELLNVVATVIARTLDSDGQKFSKAKPSLESSVSTAQHLDHFHLYSSPSAAATTKTQRDQIEDDEEEENELSLELHVDNGVMILMTAPEFFALNEDDGEDGSSSSVVAHRIPRDAIESGPAASAGLVIKPRGSEHVVQPELKDDELVVMLGQGFHSWLGAVASNSTTRPFPAVLHGMQMPSFSPSFGRVARAWVGKMILLPRSQRLEPLGLTYGEYADRARSYVLQNEHRESASFSAVACPPRMQLVPSDKFCTLRLAAPKPGDVESRAECMSWCNTHADDECAAHCDVDAAVPGGGLDCWMLCLPRLDVCGAGETAQCDPSGAQSTVCRSH